MATDLLVRINATAAGYDAAMEKARLSTYKFDTALREANLAVAQLEAELATAGPKAAAAAAVMAKKQTEANIAAQTKVGKSLGLMGIAGAAAFAMIAKSAAEFDSKMATVQSLIRDVSAKDMEGLRKSAMSAGEGIAVSATGAADAEIELAKAGISVKDIMGGALRGSLVLAAAGQTDVATATQVAASAMTQFGLAGKDVPHIADLLAAGADKALGSVADLGYALSQAGTTAHQSGISIEETTGVLAEFAQAGLIGERGGTAFKTMLLKLENPSEKAALLMQQYHLKLYDAAGQMKTMPELAGAMVDSFGKLDPAARNAALGTIFGTRAIQGANIMMQAGERVTQDWIDKVNDQGFAAHQASSKLNSLTGDLDKFKAHLSNAMVDMGESAQGPLRELIQQLDHLVAGFNGLPKPIQSTVVAILGLTTATGLLGGAMLIGVAKIAKLRLAMASTEVEAVAMRTTMAATAASIGKSFAILGAAEFAVQMIDRLHEADASVNTLSKDLDTFAHGGALSPALANTNITDAVIFGGEDPDKVVGRTQDLVNLIGLAYDDAHNFAGKVSNLGFDTDAVKQINATDDALVKLSQTDPSAAEAAFMRLVHVGNLAGLSTQHAMEEFPKFLAIWTDGYKKMGRNTEVVTQNTRAMGGAIADAGATTASTVPQYESAAQITNDLADAIDHLVEQEHRQALAAIEQKRGQLALIAANQAAEAEARKGTKTLDENTKAGQANWSVLLDMSAAWDNQKASVKGSIPAYEAQRAEFIKVAEQMGANSTEAERLATKYLGIPTSVETKMVADDSDAIRKALNLPNIFNTALGKIDDEAVNIKLSAQAKKVENTLSRFAGSGFDVGGPVIGPGTSTSDSIVARLSTGEHVWTAAEVSRAGGHKVVMGLRRLAMLGELPRRGDISAFAGGGPVTISPDASTSGVAQATGVVDSMFEQIALMLGVALSQKFNKLLTQMSFGAGSPLGLAGSLTPAGIVRGQEFAQSQVGKPYVWGGVGPGGYDCSGFQSAVLNSAHNAYPYRRLGSTASMPWDGSAPGVGRYTIGWSTNVGGSGIGHTSGNIGGLNVESNGSDGVVTGSRALSPLSSMFYGLMHYDRGGILKPGLTLAYNGTGADEHVMRFAGGGPVSGPPGHPNQITPEQLAHAIAVAFGHFGFGPKASASTIKSELTTLVHALRDALGKDSPLVDHVKRLGDRLMVAAKAQDRATAVLDKLREKEAALAQSVAATFRNDPFGNGTEGLLTQLRADRNDARKMHQALRKAKKKGLDGGLFAALAASGDLETAQQLAQMSPAEIHKYEVLWHQRQKATHTLGQFAGHTMFGDAIKKQTHVLHHLDHQIAHLEHVIDHLGHHVEHGARKGTHDGARDGMREQGRRAVLGTR
jgi:TP901 family phage tail tape measure protein